MTRISQHYGIVGPVPFVDVEVDADNRLFLDPHAIRLARGPQPFQDAAVQSLDSFFGQVTRCVLSGSNADRGHGESVLQRFTEPWETRLGMSAAGFSGHGGAAEIGSRIWTALNDDVRALVDVGALRRLEHLPLFVEGVDRDITSDIATRIVFAPLAQFTADVVSRFPEFTAGAHRVAGVSRQVWDRSASCWRDASVRLPIANDRVLLLVPKGWARSTLLMSAGRFYETTILSFAQLEQAVRDSRGKLLTTPKDRLKKQSGLARGRGTNQAVTLRAIRTEEDLITAFENFVADQIAKSERDRGTA